MVITLPSLPGPAVGLRCAFAIRGFIERSVFRCHSGLKPSLIRNGLRGPEGPLFHGAACIHGARMRQFPQCCFRRALRLIWTPFYDMAEGVPFHNCAHPRAFRKLLKRGGGQNPIDY